MRSLQKLSRIGVQNDVIGRRQTNFLEVFLNHYSDTKPARTHFARQPRNDRSVAGQDRRTSRGIVEGTAPALTPNLVANLGTVGIISTVLEIQLLHPALKGAGIINPPMAFSVEVRTSLKRVRDAEPFYAFSLKYRGAERKFAEWAANDAQPFREELARCYQTVAAKIVEQLAVPAWPRKMPVELAKGLQ